MKTAFVTCVQLGLGCMEEIVEAGGHLDLVLTLPGDMAVYKSGRVWVDAFCRAREIPLVNVRNINDPTAIAAIRHANIDYLFIIGWSQIARQALLDSPRRAAIGMHPTLLPEGRGRAAIPWTILKGLTETGVTMFQLDEGVDTGPVICQERFPVRPDETAASLYQRVALAHRSLIRRIWPEILAGRLQPVPQDESRASQWPQRTPADGEISLRMHPDEVDRLVRATTRPYPGAFLVRPEGIIRIWRGRRVRTPGPAPQGALRIAFTQGLYDALEFDIAPLPGTLP